MPKRESLSEESIIEELISMAQKLLCLKYYADIRGDCKFCKKCGLNL